MKLMKAFWNTLDKYADGVSAGLGLGVGLYAAKLLVEMFLTSHIFDTDTPIAIIALVAGLGIASIAWVVVHVVVVRRLERKVELEEAHSEVLSTMIRDSYKFMEIERKQNDDILGIAMLNKNKTTALQNKINAMKGAEKRRVKAMGVCGLTMTTGGALAGKWRAYSWDQTTHHGYDTPAQAKAAFKMRFSVEGRKSINWGKE